MSAVDRAGFTRRWGVRIIGAIGAPWFSLGLHVDWHTPSVEVHLGVFVISVGRNMYDGQPRLTIDNGKASGHTDHCTCGLT